MLRRFTSAIIQSRGIKHHQVNIKWVRPDYVPAYKPERSGDLEGIPPIPDTALGEDYALSEELKDDSQPNSTSETRIQYNTSAMSSASDPVKKIFSVAHLGQKQYNALVKKELMDRVRRHQYDENTAETRIARITGQIRCLQETLTKFPKNVKAKQTAQELIDKRKKLLKFLRQYDYKKFEWLLEKLKLEYKGHPDTYHKLTRRESLRKLTEIHCEDIRNNKLTAYRNLLESQQGPFLTEKLEALKFIRSEQIDLQLPITVTEQDVKKIEKELDDWRVRDEIKQQAKKKRKSIIIDYE